MAEGDRATVDVDFVRVDLQIADRAQHDGGKGLVDPEQIDIRRVHAGLLQRLERGWRDAGQHDRRLGVDHGLRTDPRTRLDAALLADVVVADQYRRGHLDGAGRIASEVNVVAVFVGRQLDIGHATVHTPGANA